MSEVGKDVKRFKIGDEVYVRLPERYRGKLLHLRLDMNRVARSQLTTRHMRTGSWSEYALCDEQCIAAKPKSLTFEDATAIPLACNTALQGFQRYRGSLEGKTVFIPAGCKSSNVSTLLRERIFDDGFQ